MKSEEFLATLNIPTILSRAHIEKNTPALSDMMCCRSLFPSQVTSCKEVKMSCKKNTVAKANSMSLPGTLLASVPDILEIMDIMDKNGHYGCVIFPPGLQTTATKKNSNKEETIIGPFPPVSHSTQESDTLSVRYTKRVICQGKLCAGQSPKNCALPILFLVPRVLLLFLVRGNCALFLVPRPRVLQQVLWGGRCIPIALLHLLSGILCLTTIEPCRMAHCLCPLYWP